MSLVQTGVGSIDELAHALKVSSATIRRDLRDLSESGDLIRTIGGAAAPGYVEPPLGQRMEVNAEAKNRIATLALPYLDNASTIFLDAGSTTARIAERIRNRKDLTVYTRGLEVATSLAIEGGPEVIMVGGRVSTKSHATTGALSDHALTRIRVDLAILGADAVDLEVGLGEPTLEEARTKELIARHAGVVIVVADNSKAGRHVAAWAPLPDGWLWISESGEKAQSHSV